MKGPDLQHLRVIIYDCDGVLIDSRESNQAFYNHILERFGLPPVSPPQWSEVAPLTAPAAITHLFQGTPWLDEAQRYQTVVDNRPFISLIRVEPNLKATLARLRPRYRTAIATNRGKSLPLVLQSCGLEDYFDLAVGSLSVQQAKPHPECLLKILHHFRVQPEEACYIGDSAVDQETARRAGVHFGAYKNPDLDADFYLRDHGELLLLLTDNNC